MTVDPDGRDAGEEADGGGSLDGGTADGGTRPIVFSGTCQVHHLVSSSQLDSPCDLSELAVKTTSGEREEVSVDAERGVFAVYGEATNTSQRWVTLGSDHWLTAETEVSLESTQIGRPDIKAIDVSTPITARVGRVPFWGEEYDLDVFSVSAQAGFGRLVAAGGVTVVNRVVPEIEVDWMAASHPREVRPEDEIFLLGTVRKQDIEGDDLFGVSGFGVVNGFAVFGGIPATLNGSLVAQPSKLDYGGQIDAASFLSSIQAADPEVRPERVQIQLSSIPSVETAFDGGVPLILYAKSALYRPRPHVGITVATPKLDWPCVTSVSLKFLKRVEWPAGVVQVQGQSSVARLSKKDAASGSAYFNPVDVDIGVIYQPFIGPVRNLKLNGQDALHRLAEPTGLRPTISWEAPASTPFGQASDYEVEISQIISSGEISSLASIATLHTVETELEVPPGLLVPEQSYVMRVAALSVPGVDRRFYLRKSTYPQGKADVISGSFTP